jgi:hypothetical protein
MTGGAGLTSREGLRRRDIEAMDWHNRGRYEHWSCMTGVDERDDRKDELTRRTVGTHDRRRDREGARRAMMETVTGMHGKD